MKTLLTLAVICIVVSGCQMDIQGPSMSAKIFYKDENGGDVYKSRGSGMAGGNSYAANGGKMSSNGNAGDVLCRKFFYPQGQK